MTMLPHHTPRLHVRSPSQHNVRERYEGIYEQLSMPSLNISVKGHYVMCNQVILPRRGVNLLAAATVGKGRSHPIAATSHTIDT